MATTIATVRKDIQDRHLLGLMRGEPEVDQIDSWIRSAFRHLITTLPPVRLSDLPITALNCPLPENTKNVYYVAVDSKVLFRSEWAQHEETIQIKAEVAGENSNVSIYYTTSYDLASTATEIDTSCLFGDDWLEECVTVMAGMQALNRLSARTASRSSERHASQYRVLQSQWKILHEDLKTAWDKWDLSMKMAQNERRETGDVPVSNRRQGMTNASYVFNPLIPE